jgi:hypothetical protein
MTFAIRRQITGNSDPSIICAFLRAWFTEIELVLTRCTSALVCKCSSLFEIKFINENILAAVQFLFKTHAVSETGFCLRLQVEPTPLGPIGRASPAFRTAAPKSKTLCYWRSVGQSVSLSVCLSVLVSSLILGLWPDIRFSVTVTVLSLWGALFERASLSFVRVIVGSNASCHKVQYIYILHVSHVVKCIYNIYKASVSPGSVQQIMPYF